MLNGDIIDTYFPAAVSRASRSSRLHRRADSHSRADANSDADLPMPPLLLLLLLLLLPLLLPLLVPLLLELSHVNATSTPSSARISSLFFAMVLNTEVRIASISSLMPEEVDHNVLGTRVHVVGFFVEKTLGAFFRQPSLCASPKLKRFPARICAKTCARSVHSPDVTEDEEEDEAEDDEEELEQKLIPAPAPPAPAPVSRETSALLDAESHASAGRPPACSSLQCHATWPGPPCDMRPVRNTQTEK